MILDLSLFKKSVNSCGKDLSGQPLSVPASLGHASSLSRTPSPSLSGHGHPLFSPASFGHASSLSELITNELKIPVIGIGAGNATDGQIMVIHDLLGISCLENPPKFVKDFLSETDSIEAAIKKYIHDVKSGVFPAEEHSFS